MPTQDPDAVVDAAVKALKPAPRWIAKTQVAVAACVFVALALLASSVLSLYALLGERHNAQVDFNRSFNAGLCSAIDFAADPKQPVTEREVAFRVHFHCKPREAHK